MGVYVLVLVHYILGLSEQLVKCSKTIQRRGRMMKRRVSLLSRPYLLKLYVTVLSNFCKLTTIASRVLFFSFRAGIWSHILNH